MKAYIVTLGCPKNLVDSEATASVLRRSGCDVTGDPSAADVLLVGACSFLDSAWKETVEETRRLSRYKRGSRRKKLVLMGCLPKHQRCARCLPRVRGRRCGHGRLQRLRSFLQHGAVLRHQ